MGGWHLRMTWGQEIGYTSPHSMVTSGNPRVTRCWKMTTLPVVNQIYFDVYVSHSGHKLHFYIKKIKCCKMFFIFLNLIFLNQRAAVRNWLIVYSKSGLIMVALYRSLVSYSWYSQTICWCGWDDDACLGVRNTRIVAWVNFLVWSPPWYFIVSPLLQTNKQVPSINACL